MEYHPARQKECSSDILEYGWTSKTLCRLKKPETKDIMTPCMWNIHNREIWGEK